MQDFWLPSFRSVDQIGKDLVTEIDKYILTARYLSFKLFLDSGAVTFGLSYLNNRGGRVDLSPHHLSRFLQYQAMDPKKIYEVSNEDSDSIGPHVEFYDPSKESVWTRLGVTFESFKRAPGTTG